MVRKTDDTTGKTKIVKQERTEKSYDGNRSWKVIMKANDKNIYEHK